MVDYGITRRMHGFNATTCGACTGNSNGPRGRTSYIVLHTQQGDSDAEGLANYLNGTDSVSYNLVVDDHETIEVVPVDEGPWAAAEANSIAVHICVAGSFAEWSHDEWMDRKRSLERMARATRAACEQYDIPEGRVLRGDGWPADPEGIAGHMDFGVRGGGHHDPGDGFPWDEFIGMVRGDSGDESEDDMTPEQSAKLDRIYFELTERFQSRVEDSKYRDTLVGYALNTDAAVYRLERANAELQDQIDRLEKRLGKAEGRE